MKIENAEIGQIIQLKSTGAYGYIFGLREHEFYGTCAKLRMGDGNEKCLPFSDFNPVKWVDK